MKTVLFDLDGTLLPMDQELFVKTYMKELALKGAAVGYDPQELVQIVLAGVEVMVKNDGTMTNEERFWELFMARFGGEMEKHIEVFEKFYQNEFARVANVVNPTRLANQTVQVLRDKGYELVLATNPVFPKVATLERMRWAGLNPKDFSLITTYENCHYTKPNVDYYREILAKIGAKPQECLMVGNDVQEDFSVAKLGVQVFLVTDDLINTAGDDYSQLPQGDRQGLLDYARSLPSVLS